MTFDPVLFQRSRAPIYLQVAKLLRQRIEQGEWRMGDRIPSLEELMIAYGVARSTLREALAQLEDEGVIRRSRGSGTFVIEAAEIAAGLKPGRSRRFAFEQLATFDSPAWQRLRGNPEKREPVVRFYGSDRDAGAVAMSRANAERASVAALTEFKKQAISDLTPPEGPAGLVIVNPPYGTRIGDRKQPPEFAVPGNVVFLPIDRLTGTPVDDGTPGALKEAFIAGTQPGAGFGSP